MTATLAGAARRLAVAAALLAAATAPTACHTSPPPEQYTPARDPRGVGGTLTMQDGRTVAGELLAVDDSSFVMLAGRRVGVARFGAVRRAAFAHLGPVSRSSGGRPTPQMLERARLLSRFPFGIPPAAMTALLADAQQAAPDDLAAGPP